MTLLQKLFFTAENAENAERKEKERERDKKTLRSRRTLRLNLESFVLFAKIRFVRD